LTPGTSYLVEIAAVNTLTGYLPGSSPYVTANVRTHPTGPPAGTFSNIGTSAPYPVAGWAVDYSTTSPISVQVAVDGAITTLTANQNVPGSAAANNYVGYGDDHNYYMAVPRNNTPGIHTICVTAIGVGSDGNNPLGCQSYEVTGPATPPTWSGNPNVGPGGVTFTLTDQTDGENGYHLQRSDPTITGGWLGVSYGPPVAGVGGKVTLSDWAPPWQAQDCYRAVVNMPNGTAAYSTTQCVWVPYPSAPAVTSWQGDGNGEGVYLYVNGDPSAHCVEITVTPSTPVFGSNFGSCSPGVTPNNELGSGPWKNLVDDMTPGVNYTATISLGYPAGDGVTTRFGPSITYEFSTNGPGGPPPPPPSPTASLELSVYDPISSGGGPAPTGCGSPAFTYTGTLKTPAGSGGNSSFTWNDTVPSSTYEDSSGTWFCVYNDTQHTSVELTPGTWNITVASGSGPGSFSDNCVQQPLAATLNDLIFEVGTGGCSTSLPTG
jgi:hypothetical protein